MKGIYGSYVLLLVYVDGDRKDIGGNIYPTQGHIEAKKFTRDVDIRFGLYGILWGEAPYLVYEKINKGHWLVVKAELSEDLIRTDWHLNHHKFNSGFVVCSGDLETASKYIIKNKNDFTEEAQLILSENIVGSKKWLEKRGALFYS